jgi:hypothetical protein
VIHTLSATGVAAAIPAAPQKGARLAPFCDVDRSTGANRGAIYCVYNDRTASSGLDVFLRRSTDGGVTWSAARRLNNDPTGVVADQFLPRIQIDDNSGKVNVAWYDTRDDSADRRVHVYFTRANDGATFAPSVRVTRATTDATRAGASPEAYGESLGVAAWKGRARVLWTDGRSGNEEIYSAIIDFGHPELILGGDGTLDMPRGGSDTLAVTVKAVNGFTASSTLSVSGLPSGASASFSVNPVAPNGTSVMTVRAGSAAAGSYSITLRATGGGETTSRRVSLTIR